MSAGQADPETDFLGRIARHIREAEETLDRARAISNPGRDRERRNLIAEVDAQARIAHAMTSVIARRALLRLADDIDLRDRVAPRERIRSEVVVLRRLPDADDHGGRG